MPSPQEQYGEVLRAGQEAVVNGVQAWARTTQDLLHKVQDIRPGTLHPQQVIDQAASLAEQILHLQQELATTVDHAQAGVRTAARERAEHTGDAVRPYLESVVAAIRPYVETAAHLVEQQLEQAREQAERLADALRERAEDAVDVARAAAGSVTGSAGIHQETDRVTTPPPAGTAADTTVAASDAEPAVAPSRTTPDDTVPTVDPIGPSAPAAPGPSTAAGSPPPADYSGWTKTRLQAELTARALPRSGTVAQLRSRLETADRA
ncbi:hypothetical protein JL107_02375 [Nakamurella flavida]|uniref:Uncharacterized protein n=1 Tax=Nakamurella flavida TaxID=363630 RepID=A0A938YG48_9ACTN|nr:hypothetical protein [Nakamurella flavida]MBM9475282.1 hypothetical protein [Nakamurella flavida]MDP9776856.1 ElaB/YqjD/DUF883 family membrane-anchored ribosome-binding protein [Nakamurella flavida]